MHIRVTTSSAFWWYFVSLDEMKFLLTLRSEEKINRHITGKWLLLPRYSIVQRALLDASHTRYQRCCITSHAPVNTSRDSNRLFGPIISQEIYPLNILTLRFLEKITSVLDLPLPQQQSLWDLEIRREQIKRADELLQNITFLTASIVAMFWHGHAIALSYSVC